MIMNTKHVHCLHSVVSIELSVTGKHVCVIYRHHLIRLCPPLRMQVQARHGGGQAHLRCRTARRTAPRRVFEHMGAEPGRHHKPPRGTQSECSYRRHDLSQKLREPGRCHHQDMGVTRPAGEVPRRGYSLLRRRGCA